MWLQTKLPYSTPSTVVWDYRFTQHGSSRYSLRVMYPCGRAKAFSEHERAPVLLNKSREVPNMLPAACSPHGWHLIQEAQG